MTAARHLLWFPLLFIQTGCMMLTSYSRMEPQVDQWVANKEYDRALDALSSVDAKDPHYPQASEKRRKVEALAASYEQEVRRQTRRDLDKGDWAAALDTYDEALGRLPQSAVIKDGLSQLHHQQERTLEQLEFERLMSHGRWLKETLPTYEAIAQVDPRNHAARQQLKKKRDEADAIAAELALYGNKAQANNRLDSAEKTLSLAAELSDAPAIAESLKKLHQREAKVHAAEQAEQEKRLKQQQATERAKQKRVSSVLSAYRKAYAKKDYTRARKELDTLQRIDSGNPKWDKMAEDLDKATVREAERLYDKGVSAYSRGHFEEAAKLWRKTLELKPEHKPAQESLDRAERVLRKLEKLKEKQNGGN